MYFNYFEDLKINDLFYIYIYFLTRDDKCENVLAPDKDSVIITAKHNNTSVEFYNLIGQKVGRLVFCNSSSDSCLYQSTRPNAFSFL